MIDATHCVGCFDDFYNNHNPYGIKECWHRKDAKLVPRLLIGIHQKPPFRNEPVKVPNCYHEVTCMVVPLEAIGPNGDWKQR